MANEGNVTVALKQNQLLIHALTGLMESLREHYGLPAEEVEQNVGPIYDLAADVSTELIGIRESLRDGAVA